MAPMSLDPDHPDAWKVRSRWIGVLILLALFVFLASRFLPQVHGNERAFVAGESQALQGTLLDPGLRRRYNQREWGLVDYFPRVALEDGRTVVLETSVPKDDIPAIGQPIAVRCLLQEPARCRMDTDAGLFTNAIGFGAIVLIWLLGMGTMAVKILRRPRRRTVA